MLQNQHQWKLEQKRADEIELPKVNKNNLTKTMENIVLHLKLGRGKREEGGSVSLCGLAPCQGGTYHAWILGLPEL